MTIVFFGTPAFAVPSLRAILAAGHRLPLVVTQPDRPAGRGNKLQAPAVKIFAEANGLAVAQPEKIRDPAFLEIVGDVAPDLLAVAAYGKILPKALLDLPPLGAINVHGSLLPRFRGAAPIQRAILAGDPMTGITIMQMNERMDAGDILLRRETPIAPDDTSLSLSERLSEIGAYALVEALDQAAHGTLSPAVQRDDEATLAPMVRKEEGEVDWNRPALAIERATRAFVPWPSTFTNAGDKLLKIHRAAVAPGGETDSPGTIVRAAGADLWVSTGSGILAIQELQLEGRNRLTTIEFLAGGGLRGVPRLGRSS